MHFKKHIPNLLTLANLFCGCLSLLLIFKGDNLYHQGYLPSLAHHCILILFVISLLFDLLDGMVARWLKVHSELGKQLDSLADLVSFGLVPAVMMMHMLGQYNLNFYQTLVGLLIVVFSAYRLAKFNIDTEQAYYFKGLPTPANALLIYSLFFLLFERKFIYNGFWDEIILVGTTIASCLLLVSNLPLFSFKFQDFSWKNNHFKYVFILICVVLLVAMPLYAIPLIIAIYIIISIIFRKKILS